MKDYYKILGIEKQATEEQIKKAYRKLAKKYHPDVVKDDPAKQERMYEIQEAYECLGNEQRRRKYDSNCAGVPHKGAGVRPERDRKGNPAPSGPKMPDLSPFERFFGFTPGKGMETICLLPFLGTWGREGTGNKAWNMEKRKKCALLFSIS